MNKSDIPKGILQTAMRIVGERLEDFPEDEWITLSNHWELNLFTTDSGERIATIYAVKNGDIDSQDFVRIFQQSPQSSLVTPAEIEVEFERATKQEQQWLTQQEAPFADRALDEIPDDADLDDLLTNQIYPLIGGGYAIVRRRDGFDEPLGLTYSRLNPHGIFTSNGQQIGSTCGCEDYPCCGH